MICIRDIAQVSAGMSFRGRIVHEASGELAVIQMRDITGDYSAFSENCARVAAESRARKYLLRKGDVLLLAKGSHNYAIRYTGVPSEAAASSVFFVLRPFSEKVLPEYLTWYLNHPAAQQYFKQHHTGTYTPSLNKEAVEMLEVPLPPLKAQKLIGEAYRCGLREKHILSQLEHLRTQKLEHQLYQKALQNA